MVFAAFNILLIMSLSVCCCVQYATFYFHYSLHEKFDLHQIQVYVVYYHAYFGQCLSPGMDSLNKEEGMLLVSSKTLNFVALSGY